MSLNPIVRGTKPSPGIVTLTPRSDVRQFLLNILPPCDNMVDMLLYSSTISTSEQMELMLAYASPQLAIREGRLYDVSTAGNMVWVPMGSSGLWVGETEVTTDQFLSQERVLVGRAVNGSPDCLGTNKRPEFLYANNKTSGYPERATWFQAVIFCNVMSFWDDFKPYYTIRWHRLPGSEEDPDTMEYDPDAAEYKIDIHPNANGYRLPTISEWNQVKKGTAGLDLTDIGWFGTQTTWVPGPRGIGSQAIGRVKDNLHRVAEKRPDHNGLYDLYGNLNEWCWDEEEGTELFQLGDAPLRPHRGGHFRSDVNYVRANDTDDTAEKTSGRQISSSQVGFRLYRSGK